MAIPQNFRQRINDWKAGHRDFLKTYQEHNAFWVSSDMTDTEEMKSRLAFADTFREEQTDFMRTVFRDSPEDMRDIMRDPGCVQLMKEAGLYTYAKDLQNLAEVRPAVQEHPAPYNGDRDAMEKVDVDSSGEPEGPGDLFVEGQEDYPGESLSEVQFRKNSGITRGNASFLIDGSLTAKQQENLREVRKWLYENAPHTGYASMGGNGSMRSYIDSFMKKPLAVQMAAIYLVNTNKRKAPEPMSLTLAESQLPDNLMEPKDFKKRMRQCGIKNLLKFSRLSGSQFFWKKLQTSVDLAEKSTSLRDAKELRYDLKNQYGSEPAVFDEHQKTELNSRIMNKIAKADEIENAANALDQLHRSGTEFKNAFTALQRLEQNDPEEGDREAFLHARQVAVQDLVNAAKGVKEVYENNRKSWNFLKPVFENAKGFTDTMFSVNGLLLYGTASALVDNTVTIIQNPGKNDPKFRITSFLADNILNNDVMREYGIKNFLNLPSAEHVVGYTDLGKGAALGLSSALNAIGDLRDLFKKGETLSEKIGNLLSLGTNISTGMASFAMNYKNYLINAKDMASDSVDVAKAGNFAANAGVAAKAFGTVKNFWQGFRNWLRHGKAKKLQKTLKEDKTAEFKTLKTATAMTRKRSKWKALKYVGLGILGAAGTVVGVLALPAVGIAAAATVSVATVASVVGTKLITDTGEFKEKDTESKKAVDNELLRTRGAEEAKEEAKARAALPGHEKDKRLRTIDYAAEKYRQRLEARKSRFDNDSEETKSIESRIGDKDAMKRQVRDQRAVEEGAMNTVDFARLEHKKAIETAFLKVFFKDGAREMTAANLRKKGPDNQIVQINGEGWIFDKASRNVIRTWDGDTPAERREIAKKRQLLHYYDFLKMNGVKMEPSRQKAKGDKTEEQMKFDSIMERKEKAVGKRR